MNQPTLIEKVDAYIRKHYHQKILRGSIISITLILSLGLLAVGLEYAFEFEVLGRTLLFYALLLTSLLLLGNQIGIPLLRYFKVTQGLSRYEAARIIGKSFDEIDDKLLNSLQLVEMQEHDVRHRELILKSIEHRSKKLGAVRFSEAIKFKEAFALLKYTIVPVVVVALFFLVAPHVLIDPSYRLASHRTTFVKPSPFTISILSPSLSAIQNEDFKLEVKIDGDYLPGEVLIDLKDQQFLLMSGAPGVYTYLFKNVRATQSFSIVADGYASSPYSLKVNPKPSIVDMTIELDFPAYLQLESRSISNNGNLNVPEGTNIKWFLKSENIDEVNLSFQGEEPVTNHADGGRTLFNKVALSSNQYSLTYANNSIDWTESLQYTLDVVKDEFPSIEVRAIGDSTSLKELYFSGSMSDDYGLSSLSFVYIIKGDNPKEAVTERIEITPNLPNQTFYHFWSLDSLNISAGDELVYWFVVGDNDGVNGSKKTKSNVFVHRVPSVDELKKEQQKAHEELSQNMEEAMLEAKKLKEEIREIKESLLDKKSLQWQDKKRIQDLMSRQSELEKQLNELSKQNRQNDERKERINPSSPELLEKQRKIQELMDNVLTEELKKQMEELEKLLEKLDKNKLQRQMEQMELSNEEMEKELDRTLELFKQLDFERSLQDLSEKVDEIQKEQSALSEDTENNAEKQEALNEAFEEAMEDLKKLDEKNDDLQSPNNMQEIKQDAKSAQESMKQSEDQLKKNQKSKGKQSQKVAKEQLNELSDDLQALQDQLSEDKPMEDLEALRRLLENIIQLSFDQEDMIEAFGKINPQDPKYTSLTQEQNQIKDDSQIIQDSLFALSKRVMEMAPNINREISEVNENLDKAINALEDRKVSEGRKRQQYVMTALNNLALMLDESIQAAQQQMSSNMFGKASCSKPGQGKKPSASSLKQMQQQLKKQMEALKKQLEQGGGKGDGKKPGSNPGLSESLAKLASRQAAIRNELRKLQESLENEGHGSGDLKKIQELMEETEKDLIYNNLNLETIKRQEKIISQLLESEKAEREREMDNKRKSKEGNDREFGNLFNLDQYKRQKQKESELLKTIPPRLSPYYKYRVSEYLYK